MFCETRCHRHHQLRRLVLFSLCRLRNWLYVVVIVHLHILPLCARSSHSYVLWTSEEKIRWTGCTDFNHLNNTEPSALLPAMSLEWVYEYVYVCVCQCCFLLSLILLLLLLFVFLPLLLTLLLLHHLNVTRLERMLSWRGREVHTKTHMEREIRHTRTYTRRGKSAHTRTGKERDNSTHAHTDGEGGTAHALTHGERFLCFLLTLI